MLFAGLLVFGVPLKADAKGFWGDLGVTLAGDFVGGGLCGVISFPIINKLVDGLAKTTKSLGGVAKKAFTSGQRTPLLPFVRR